jgi:hypothetical protein
MHAHQFGRKLKLPSTIAIKHQIRKLMTEDEIKKEAAEARAQSTDLSQINVGPERQTRHLSPPEGSLVK